MHRFTLILLAAGYLLANYAPVQALHIGREGEGMFNEFFDRNDGKSDNNDAYHEEYQEQMGDEDNMVEDPDEEEDEQELYIPKARKDAFQNEDSFLSDPKAAPFPRPRSYYYGHHHNPHHHHHHHHHHYYYG